MEGKKKAGAVQKQGLFTLSLDSVLSFPPSQRSNRGKSHIQGTRKCVNALTRVVVNGCNDILTSKLAMASDIEKLEYCQSTGTTGPSTLTLLRENTSATHINEMEENCSGMMDGLKENVDNFKGKGKEVAGDDATASQLPEEAELGSLVNGVMNKNDLLGSTSAIMSDGEQWKKQAQIDEPITQNASMDMMSKQATAPARLFTVKKLENCMDPLYKNEDNGKGKEKEEEGELQMQGNLRPVQALGMLLLATRMKAVRETEMKATLEAMMDKSGNEVAADIATAAQSPEGVYDLVGMSSGTSTEVVEQPDRRQAPPNQGMEAAAGPSTSRFHSPPIVASPSAALSPSWSVGPPASGDSDANYDSWINNNENVEQTWFKRIRPYVLGAAIFIGGVFVGVRSSSQNASQVKMKVGNEVDQNMIASSPCTSHSNMNGFVNIKF